VIQEAAARFRRSFGGRTLYAVKCNPHPFVLRALLAAGIRDFDVASLPEIEQVRAQDSEAGVHFMHPVKERGAIREAYHRHGVRHFVVDHPEELEKVFVETGARDLVVFVRLATPKAAVLYHLSAKFGATPEDAAWLMRTAAWCGAAVGLTFHVGSQCLDPNAFRVALEGVGKVVAHSGVEPAYIDVGGGFPHRYSNVEAPPLEDFVTAIRDGLQHLGLRAAPRLWAEPGRVLVAAGCSVIVQVRLRKDDQLYINDGVYGSFSELIDSSHELPARLLRQRGEPSGTLREFVLHGPTCDSMDTLPPPLRLPDDVGEGDWIEVDQVGAYSSALSTRFNGFAVETFAEVFDEPPARALSG
jgi:ornithine decarboxylase